jgi:membrane protease YdiL (CAAX protease family)
MNPTTITERPTAAPRSPEPAAPPAPLAPPGQPRGGIQRHPVLTYFALTFALSWGGALLLTGGLALMSGADWRSDPRFLFAVLAAPVAPGVVGLLLTGLTSGRDGYRELLARLLRWRVEARWYAVALLPAPLFATAVLLALSLRSPEFLPAVFTTHDPVGLLLPGVATALVVAFCEELGWTGFAIPRLRRQYGVLTTGLVVGVLWGAWHFPLFRESGSSSGALPLTLLLVRLFSWLPACRVLLVWVYDRTGSLLVPMLMHASISASSLILSPPVLSDVQSLTSVLVSATAWWAVVAAVAVANGGKLTRESLRRRAA